MLTCNYSVSASWLLFALTQTGSSLLSQQHDNKYDTFTLARLINADMLFLFMSSSCLEQKCWTYFKIRHRHTHSFVFFILICVHLLFIFIIDLFNSFCLYQSLYQLKLSLVVLVVDLYIFLFLFLSKKKGEGNNKNYWSQTEKDHSGVHALLGHCRSRARLSSSS